MSNIYIIKNLAPWMMDELKAFSKLTSFKIVFLRKQKDYYNDDMEYLINNGVQIFIKPQNYKNIILKLLILRKFIINNISKFSFDYNGIIGLKSLFWFLSLDLSIFNDNTKIHSQFATQASIIALLIKNYYNNKPQYSFTFHANDIYFNNNWFALLVLNSNHAFSISEYNIRYVKDKYFVSDKITLSRLGVFNNNHKIKQSLNNRVLTIGFLSWFVQKKGIIYLLKALKTLSNEGINIKLKLAGAGPLKKKILAFIYNNQLQNFIEYLGPIKNKEKDNFFNSIDVFVLPAIKLKNDMDGLPVVLMEAVSYGVPIISTNISGIPEICRDNYNGFLIPERDSQAIVNAIMKIKESDELRDSFSLNSIEMSLKYDININSSKKIELLGW